MNSYCEICFLFLFIKQALILLCRSVEIRGLKSPKGCHQWLGWAHKAQKEKKKWKERNVPAAGVMQTKPVIMPCIAPNTRGFPKKMVSRINHVIRLVAAQTWVLRTARDASKLATAGAPPLKPLHPIHSSPAPPSIRIILLGGKLSLSPLALGPTFQNQYDT